MGNVRANPRPGARQASGDLTCAMARVAKGGGVRDANKHNNCPIELATGPQRIRLNAMIRPDAGCRMPDAGCRMAPLASLGSGHEGFPMAAGVPSSVLPA